MASSLGASTTMGDHSSAAQAQAQAQVRQVFAPVTLSAPIAESQRSPTPTIPTADAELTQTSSPPTMTDLKTDGPSRRTPQRGGTLPPAYGSITSSLDGTSTSPIPSPNRIDIQEEKQALRDSTLQLQMQPGDKAQDQEKRDESTTRESTAHLGPSLRTHTQNDKSGSVDPSVTSYSNSNSNGSSASASASESVNGHKESQVGLSATHHQAQSQSQTQVHHPNQVRTQDFAQLPQSQSQSQSQSIPQSRPESRQQQEQEQKQAQAPATNSDQDEEEYLEEEDGEVFQEGEAGRGKQLGHRGYLPTGMDVRDALARCEDPTLGWSLQFWVTIADPLTQHVFFACPASGQCSWDPPVGAFVVPRSPDGEWWELADSTRGNRSYYYNTLTGKTQWTRPGGNAFVIPLGLIQRTALPSRDTAANPSSSASRIVPSTPSRDRTSKINSLSPIKTPNHAGQGYPRPPHSPYSSVPRPIYSPSKSNRSSSLSPSSSYGPSQTLEAIVLGHFTSPSSYVVSGDADQTTPTKRRSKSEGILKSTSNPHSLSLALTPSRSTLKLAPASGQTNDTNSGSAISPGGPKSPLTILEEGSGNETDMSDNSGASGPSAGWWDRRKSQVLTVKTFGSPKRKQRGLSGEVGSPVDGVNGAMAKGSPLKRGRSKISGPIFEQSESIADDTPGESPTNTNGTNESSGPALPKAMPAEPIYVEPVGSVKTKRMSTGLHPLLPTEISNELLAVGPEDFARRYFATKRSGVLRQRVPVEKILEWQKQPISSPLLVLSKHLQKDAITIFKVIQHVMGERDRAVENAKPMTSSSSHLNLASLALGGRKGDEGHPQRGGRLANGFEKEVGSTMSLNGNANGNVAGNGNGVTGKSEKMQVLEEIRWMIQLCVASGEMRDEVYCQLVKQLTRNPNHDAIVLAFQLFCVLTNAFGPGKNFEPFVRNFLRANVDEPEDGVGVMAKYCLAKLDIFTKGTRGKTLTVGEIEHASDAAFYPSVYGESLDRIMDLQKRAYPTLKVPVILPFLGDGILALGGLQSEGIFRVPGDGDSVAELKSRMDRGHYQLKGIDDPHVAASLFKLWLRELEEPIVPTSLYNEALMTSRSAQESVEFVYRLPIYNRRVLLFVISFVKLFMGREVVEKTKMTPGNLALVMAPNILRTTSNSLVTVFTNSTFESKFILNLLEHLDPSVVDPDYTPSHGQAIGRV